MLGLEAWPRSRGQILLALASALGCLALVSIIWPRPRVERGQGRGLWVWACEVRGCFTIVLIYILLIRLRLGIQIIWAIWDEFNEMLGHFRIVKVRVTSSSFWTVIFLRTIWASFSALASNLWPRSRPQALWPWPRPWPQDVWPH